MWAVVASSIASMVVGSIWYGPLFGKKYISAMGWDNQSQAEKDAMKKGMALTYLWQFIASLVTFYVLGWIITHTDQGTVSGGIQAALWIWIGFAVPFKLGDSLWGGKKILFWLNIGNMLFTLIAGGAILGYWR